MDLKLGPCPPQTIRFDDIATLAMIYKNLSSMPEQLAEKTREDRKHPHESCKTDRAMTEQMNLLEDTDDGLMGIISRL